MSGRQGSRWKNLITCRPGRPEFILGEESNTISILAGRGKGGSWDLKALFKALVCLSKKDKKIQQHKTKHKRTHE
jgi:hypothetical protein